MTTQKTLLATILTLICLCAVPCASYAGTSTLRAWGGGVWLHDNVKDYDIKYSTGYAYGASYGTSWFCYFRTEIEAFYLHNSIRDLKVDSKPVGITGSIENYGALFNLAVECPFTISKMELCPYIGAGLGVSYEKSKLNISNYPVQKETERRFSHQYFGGLSMPIFPFFIGEISASIEGRYYVFDKDVRAVMAIGGLALKF